MEGLTVSAFDLTGKKALVTGASRGIGQAIAVALAQAGADVALLARTEEGLAATAKQVTGCGREAVVIPADVTTQEAVEVAVNSAIDALGQLDIIVNNAAGSHLVSRGTGSVINVASVAGLVGAPFLSPYGAAKAGLISLTKSLAVEWAALGVRVNALCPGWTATDLNRNLWEDESAGQATVANVPMQRWGKPEEMTGAAVFLASDASTYMTGQVLVIDGGQTALA